MTEDSPRRRRVASIHRTAAAAFRLAGAFLVLAAAWGGWAALRGGWWWGPVHAFLAGAVLLAISGATQLFTVTWAAAVPPSPTATALQRWTLTTGVVAVLAGVTHSLRPLVVAGAVLAGIGVVLLAGLLIAAVRRSLLRRFDLATRFYLLALASGTVGIVLGAVVGGGWSGSAYLRLRTAHLHLNLVGLVGLTIVGTLPTFLPTLARHRAVSGREVRWAWWGGAAAVAAFLVGTVVGQRAVGLGGLTAAASATVVLGGIVARLGRRGLRGGLPYLQVVAGTGWLVAWATADGLRLLGGLPPEPFPPWTAAVILGGVAQVLLGALAYLVPVLLGPGPRLGPRLRRMAARPAVPFVAANVAAAGALGDAAGVVAAATGVWIVDFAVRLARLPRHPPRPTLER